MTRVLVTGASGLLGINVALEAAKNYEVVGATFRQPLHDPGFATVEMDLLEGDAPAHLLEETAPDWVIHCAALANLDTCEHQPELAHHLNTILPGCLAAETAKRNMRFVHISTDAVFNGVKGYYREEDAPAPLSVYGRTKRLAELAVKSANPQTLIVRPNLFGWSVSGDRSLAEFFYKNLSAGISVRGFTDRLFCPLLANDLAAIILTMLEKKLRGIFHVSSSDHLSKYDFGVAIAKRFGLDASLIEPATADSSSAPASRSPDLTLNTAKVAKVLGGKTPSVAAGIDRLFELERSGYRAKLQAMAAAPEVVKG